MSSSSMFSLTRSSPQPNSFESLKQSTTETTLSSLHMLGRLYSSLASATNVIDWTIGIGSQMPDASIKM